MFSRDQWYGLTTERWVFNQLVKKGYKPEYTRFDAANCDLKVNDLPIEVKGATRTWRTRQRADGSKIFYPRWQWWVHDTARDMAQEWVLILVAETKVERHAFILPGSAIGERNHLQITSHPTVYSGWMAQYLGRWDVIEYLSKGVYQNGGPLFDAWGVAA